MDQAVNTQLHIPSSVKGFTEARHKLQEENHQQAGVASKGHGSVWRNFGPSLERFRYSFMQMKKPHSLGLPKIIVGCNDISCPCCWRVVQAVNMDGCLGFTRLRKAAAQQRERCSMYSSEDTLWAMTEEEVKTAIQNNKGITLPDSHLCSDFTVFSALGRRSEYYEDMGRYFKLNCLLNLYGF